ncbi:MAG: hypothetical protein ACYS74_24365 [Planctomycetota bacterium]|jgi:hypothetical protein
MVNTVDPGRKFYDPMAGFRDMAVSGKLCNGREIIGDPRSSKRTTL